MEITTAHFVVIFEAIHQQVGCEIDVGTLLLGVEYLDSARAGLLGVFAKGLHLVFTRKCP